MAGFVTAPYIQYQKQNGADGLSETKDGPPEPKADGPPAPKGGVVRMFCEWRAGALSEDGVLLLMSDANASVLLATPKVASNSVSSIELRCDMMLTVL